jgi:hypothetical protein
MDSRSVAKELVRLAKAVAGADALDADQVARDFDTRGLEGEVRKRAGFDPKLEVKVKPGRHPGELRVEIQSDNLVEKVGLFSAVFDDVRIASGSNSISAEKGELMAWIVVDIRWSHKGGGTNGASWFTAWYEFGKKKWTFKDR